MNRSLNALLLGALIAFPAVAAPNPSPDAKVAKSKVAHIMTIKVTGMSWASTWGGRLKRALDGLAPVSKVGQVASDQFEITYDPGKLSPKDIGATVEKLGFGHSLKSPVAASVRTKHLMVQSMTTATSYRAGGKGTLKVGVFLGKNKTLGSTTITITGPEGLEAEVKFLPSVDKAKKVVEVPFGFTKDAKKGSHDLKVTVRYTTQKGGKDKEAFVVTYTLPVTLE